MINRYDYTDGTQLGKWRRFFGVIKSDRGSLLAFTLVTALASSIVVYGLLTATTTRARIDTVLGGESRARYAAEAGLVIARETLMRDAQYCGTPVGNPWPLDTDANGVADTRVEISVSPCGAGNEYARHVIKAKVKY